MIHEPDPALVAFVDSDPVIEEVLRRMHSAGQSLFRSGNPREPWRVEYQDHADPWRATPEIVARMVEGGALTVTNAYQTFDDETRTWTKRVAWRCRLTDDAERLVTCHHHRESRKERK